MQQAFGLVIRQLRMRAKLSQEELAAASGYHRTYISLVERGLKNPTLSTVCKLAQTFSVPPSELLRRSEEMLDLSEGDLEVRR